VIEMKNKLFFVLAVFNLLFYLAMKSIWSGIEGMFGIAWLQYLLLGILGAVAIVALAMVWKRSSGALPWVNGVLAIVLCGALAYMFYLGIGSLRYILRSFLINLGIFFGICLILYFLFRYPKTSLAKSRLFRSFLAVALVLGVATFLVLANLVMISAHPVVYSVEEEYQIVWTTTINATGSVKIGDETYRDLAAGSEDSFTKVHKVVVPTAVLDAAEKYEIISTNYIYRGPYSGLLGRTIKQEVDFRPIDPADGLQIYSLSDAHEYVEAAVKTGAYFGEDLDLLVLAGDIASHLERTSDIELILKIAHGITGGSRAVIYARGNHEVKGDVANSLYRYVGSKDEAFYYTFRLGPVFGIVLDLGEDHPDDWWEYYGTAHFEDYRNIQTEFLNQVLSDGNYLDPSVEFKLAICHMPVTYVSSHDGKDGQDSLFLEEIRQEWTTLLNTLDPDLMISGHLHELMQFLPDMTPFETLYYHPNYQDSLDPKGYMTDAGFPTFIISRRSDTQDPSIKENLFGNKLIGLATEVDLTEQEMSIVYTNTLHDIIPIIRPFSGESVTAFTFDITA